MVATKEKKDTKEKVMRDNVGSFDLELRIAIQALDDAISSAVAAKLNTHFRWAETKELAKKRLGDIKGKIRRLENIIGIRS